MFLHISPSGDWWIAQELFAAKHLQDGYVRSIRLPEGFDDETIQKYSLNEVMKMYDSGKLP
jgi:hypothetical protein